MDIKTKMIIRAFLMIDKLQKVIMDGVLNGFNNIDCNVYDDFEFDNKHEIESLLDLYADKYVLKKDITKKDIEKFYDSTWSDRYITSELEIYLNEKEQ